MQHAIIEQIGQLLASLTEDKRIEAINQIRLTVHAHSPFKENPVDCVLWVKHEEVIPNRYNPNNVAPPEKRLLQKSLEADGFTQPVVVYRQEDHYEIVDGFHRHALAKSKATLKRQLKGYVPVSCLSAQSSETSGRMASTIRHNRARGRHQINAMADIVRELAQLGWNDEKISAELGMDADEVLRLRQMSGLLDLFADRQFSQAWTVK
ncbi:ParB/RepB/Spo0J family partition protein [Pluralibacter sp.]|uniref:IbrB-like domain-containing protein n=1 Tax=Pluralibacter sp. TaxID=1920032 RepID=UPI0025D92D62|nr:ParB/RepB/Spo0J family partition protein [Pluralibacter sp.]MBV8042976.1 ParB-like nuclease domain-containing protein [Pluralibacter sp.]